jgi:hypothetical protein
MLFEDGADTTAVQQAPAAPIEVSEPTSVPKAPQQVPQGPKSAFLRENALICRAAEQLPKYLADVENNRAPNKADCAINPKNERMRVDIVERRTIDQEVLVHWRKPSNGFEGWTLERHLVQ